MVLDFLWILLLGLNFFLVFGSIAMPSIYNKMQPIGGTASDSTTKEQTTMPHSENFPGGLWINGVRVDVAGGIAPKRAAIQGNCRNRNNQLSRAQLPSTYLPWTWIPLPAWPLVCYR